MFSLICNWINSWINNPEAGDSRRHRAHCDVSVMGSNLIAWLYGIYFVIGCIGILKGDWWKMNDIFTNSKEHGGTDYIISLFINLLLTSIDKRIYWGRCITFHTQDHGLYISAGFIFAGIRIEVEVNDKTYNGLHLYMSQSPEISTHLITLLTSHHRGQCCWLRVVWIRAELESEDTF